MFIVTLHNKPHLLGKSTETRLHLHFDYMDNHISLNDKHILKIRDMFSSIYFKKVQVGNDQEMAQSDRNSHSINRGVGKT